MSDVRRLSASSAALADPVRAAGDGQEQFQGSVHSCHVGGLYPDHLQLLSEPFEVFDFDFGQPPDKDRSLQVEVSTQTLQSKAPHDKIIHA